MHIEAFRAHCLARPGVTEDFPFDDSTLVFKVGGKMFALTDVDTFDAVNLKCDPERAERLRDQYDAVRPGYHMNKRHWNTVVINADVPDNLILEWIDHSYELVLRGLSKKMQQSLQ